MKIVFLILTAIASLSCHKNVVKEKCYNCKFYTLTGNWDETVCTDDIKGYMARVTDQYGNAAAGECDEK